MLSRCPFHYGFGGGEGGRGGICICSLEAVIVCLPYKKHLTMHKVGGMEEGVLKLCTHHAALFGINLSSAKILACRPKKPRLAD